MAVRLEVIGFAGAAPLQGACPSYLLSDGQRRVLLDCGPGTLERVWRRGLLSEIDAIVISHMHADHMLDLLPWAGDVVGGMLGERRIELYVPREQGPAVLRALNDVFARERGAATRFDAVFDVCEYDADDRLTVGGLRFSFSPTAHAQPCFAARVSDGRRAIVYGADGAASPSITQFAGGADLLILEATFLDDEAASAEHGHMTAAQAGELARRAGAGRLLLTHTLPTARVTDLARAAAQTFGGEVQVAHEGYVYEG